MLFEEKKNNLEVSPTPDEDAMCFGNAALFMADPEDAAYLAAINEFDNVCSGLKRPHSSISMDELPPALDRQFDEWTPYEHQSQWSNEFTRLEAEIIFPSKRARTESKFIRSLREEVVGTLDLVAPEATPLAPVAATASPAEAASPSPLPLPSPVLSPLPLPSPVLSPVLSPPRVPSPPPVLSLAAALPSPEAQRSLVESDPADVEMEWNDIFFADADDDFAMSFDTIVEVAGEVAGEADDEADDKDADEDSGEVDDEENGETVDESEEAEEEEVKEEEEEGDFGEMEPVSSNEGPIRLVDQPITQVFLKAKKAKKGAENHRYVKVYTFKADMSEIAFPVRLSIAYKNNMVPIDKKVTLMKKETAPGEKTMIVTLSGYGPTRNVATPIVFSFTDHNGRIFRVESRPITVITNPTTQRVSGYFKSIGLVTLFNGGDVARSEAVREFVNNWHYCFRKEDGVLAKPIIDEAKLACLTAARVVNKRNYTAFVKTIGLTEVEANQ